MNARRACLTASAACCLLLALQSPAAAQAWRDCIPGSIGTDGGLSIGPGGGQSIGAGGGLSIDRDWLRGLDTRTMRPAGEDSLLCGPLLPRW